MKMAPSIGVNLRVTGHCNQGGRKYMEDVFSVAYQQTEDEKDLEYAFFGIFDGHGGREAALFAKEHLMDFIVRQKNFWSDDDELVLKAIKDGFLATHLSMWKELEIWPRTASGLPSTSGTTSSIAFIRCGKIYIGHVGDSAIVLGCQEPGDPSWYAEPLTRDHKPECAAESHRIQESGGKVVCKSGVPRVVWNRPRIGHKGPVRRSTPIDEIPFLAVARSLGDLWSYNSASDQFVVSPEPDVSVMPIDIRRHRCLVLGTDGLWNMMTSDASILTVLAAERHNEKHMLSSYGNGQTRIWINPSKKLVDRALERWNNSKLRADNTSVITVMLDPPGPPRAQVLKRRLELAQAQQQKSLGEWNNNSADSCSSDSSETSSSGGSVSAVTKNPLISREAPSRQNGGVAIISRYPNTGESKNLMASNSVSGKEPSPDSSVEDSSKVLTRIVHDSVKNVAHRMKEKMSKPACRREGCPVAASSQYSIQDQENADPMPVASEKDMLMHCHKNSGENNYSDDIQINEISSSGSVSDVLSPENRAVDEENVDCVESMLPLSEDKVPLKPVSASKLSDWKTREDCNNVITEKSKSESHLVSVCDDDSLHAKRRRTRSEEKSGERIEETNASSTINNTETHPCKKAKFRASLGSWEDVEMKCKQLNKKIKQMEKKVAKKTQELNQEVKMLRSTIVMAHRDSDILKPERHSMSSVVSHAFGNTHFLRSSNLTCIDSPRTLRSRNFEIAATNAKRKRMFVDSSQTSDVKSIRIHARQQTWGHQPSKPMLTRSKCRFRK